MRFSARFHFILAAILCLLTGFGLASQAQTGFPPCREDGSIPDGYNQCDCQEWLTYRGEYNNPEFEYRVKLPDRVVAFDSGCVGNGHGFDIDLTHPNSGQARWEPWSVIRTSASRRSREELQKGIDGWKQGWSKDIEVGRKTSVQLGQPEQTSLGSLPAVRLKATWTEADHGKLISEQIFASNPEGTISYEFVMICAANRYEKSLKLFHALVESFRYVPR